VTAAPRVPGQVATVEVNDNQLVKTGQILVTLDPRDYQASLAMAEATLERPGPVGIAIAGRPFRRLHGPRCLADNPYWPLTARPRFFGTDPSGQHC